MPLRMMRSTDSDESEGQGTPTHSQSSDDDSFIASEDSDISVDSETDASYVPPAGPSQASSSSSSSSEDENVSGSEVTGSLVSFCENAPALSNSIAQPTAFVWSPAPSLPLPPVPSLPSLPEPVPNGPGTRYPKRERRAAQDTYLQNNMRRVRRVLENDERLDLLRESRDWNNAPPVTNPAELRAQVANVSTSILRTLHRTIAQRHDIADVDEVSDKDDTDADAESDSSVS